MNHQRGTYSLSSASLLLCGIVSASVFLAVCIFTLIAGRNGTHPILPVSADQLSSGWTDRDGNAVTLPTKLSYPQSGVYVIRTVLRPEDIETKAASLLFFAKYMNVTLFLDDMKIGSCLCKPEDVSKTIGKTFLIAPLPKDAVGKELRIEAVPLLGEGMEYEINAPIFGTSGRLVYDLISSELPMLMILEAIFCFGLLLMLFSWQARRTGNSTFFQVGLFAILFAMYSLTITDTVHLFINNSGFIYLMEFLLLALFPLPLMKLVYYVCIPKFRHILLAGIGMLTINFCLQVVLYFFTGVELRDMVLITHVLMILSALILIPTLVLSGRQGGERFRLLVSFSPALIGALLDISRFYLPGIYQKAVSFQLGVLMFIFLQTAYLVRSYLKSDLYRKVAYTDVLTGLQNRTAFEERIVQLEKSVSHYASVWCVCADVNDLKKINDTLGHSEGDELIRGAAKVLLEVKSGDSNLYRTGGDEFVLFAYNQSEKSMEQGRARFEAAIRRYNQALDASLSIALGYDCFCKGDTITKLISRADSIMYDDKHKQKEEQKKMGKNND